jgi:methionine synthase II (cobalamin-independent)
MANFKRKKTRRNVRCTLCTPVRWKGNHAGRFDPKDEQLTKEVRKEIRSFVKEPKDEPA